MGTENRSHLFCPLLGQYEITVFLAQRTGVAGNDQSGLRSNGAFDQGSQQLIVFLVFLLKMDEQ